MKTPYFVWTNRVITLFFLNNEKEEFINAFMDFNETGDIANLCDAACLEISDKSKPKSRWPQVKDEHDLIAQCQRMKSDDKYLALTKEELEEIPMFKGTMSTLDSALNIRRKDDEC